MTTLAINGFPEEIGVYAADDLRTGLAFSVFGIPFLVRAYRPTYKGPLLEH